jgi:hypothetical protein
MLGSLSEAEDAVQEVLAAAQPFGREQHPESCGMAEDSRRASMPGYAALASVAAGRTHGRASGRDRCGAGVSSLYFRAYINEQKKSEGGWCFRSRKKVAGRI